MNKKLAYGLLAGAVAAAAAGWLERTGLAARWDYALSDWRARLLAEPSPATPRVKLVLVDQASLDWASRNLGWSWPWPREAYAAVLNYLKRNGAKTAVWDVLFTEPSAYGVPDDEALGAAAGDFGPFVGAVFLGHQADQATAWPDYARPIPGGRGVGGLAGGASGQGGGTGFAGGRHFRCRNWRRRRPGWATCAKRRTATACFGGPRRSGCSTAAYCPRWAWPAGWRGSGNSPWRHGWNRAS
jgi:hypothetical protein